MLAQISTGYETSSGFREAFSRILGNASACIAKHKILHAAWLDTKLGPMFTIADEKYLYLLEFANRRGLEREVERLGIKLNMAIVPGHTPPIHSIEKELQLYFQGKLQQFKTPLSRLGTPFQKEVWSALDKIPYGQTRSYLDIAKAVGNPQGFRAVASANGSNQLAIVIPCHRVIKSNGDLCGYAGTVSRKEWLLKHEKENC